MKYLHILRAVLKTKNLTYYLLLITCLDMVDISRFYWLYQTYNLFNVLVVIPDAISQCIFTAARRNVPAS